MQRMKSAWRNSVIYQSMDNKSLREQAGGRILARLWRFSGIKSLGIYGG
jgi:hypothetical protein